MLTAVFCHGWKSIPLFIPKLQKEYSYIKILKKIRALAPRTQNILNSNTPSDPCVQIIGTSTLKKRHLLVTEIDAYDHCRNLTNG